VLAAWSKIFLLAGLVLSLGAVPAWPQTGLDYMESNRALDDLSQGIRYNEAGKQDLAIKRYTYAIDSGRLDKDNLAIAYNNRANAWVDKEEYKQAVGDYSQALTINPNFLEAYFNRGIAYYRLQEYDKSYDDFSRAISLDRDNASAFFNRSFPLAKKGLVQKAIEDVQQALRISPDNDKYAAQLVELR